MDYKVEKLATKPSIAAAMKMTVPDYSKDLVSRAVKTMEKELKRKGITLASPPYNFMIAHDSTYRIEVIDIEIFVCVENKGKDSEMIRFVSLPSEDELIRITTSNFEDVHIGLAEWMHEHDYVADGDLRAVVHDGPEYIYDCPVKKAED